MKHRYFKTQESFFNPKLNRKPKVKVKALKPIQNLAETERKQRERSNQIEDIGKRAAVSHNISNQPLNDPNGIN